MTKDATNYVMLSGFSSELLKHVLNGTDLTPYTMMMHVLEPYNVPIDQDCLFLHDRPFDFDQLEEAIKASTFKKAYRKSTTTNK